MAFSSVLDLVFPTICLTCGTFTRAAKTLCHDCLLAIPLHAGLFCCICGLPLPAGSTLCHRGAPYILGCATKYRWSSVAALVKTLKFSFQRQAAHALAQLLILYARNIPFDFLDRPLVIPIPLSRQRERQRDFNQAEEIGGHFATYFRLPMASRALKRLRNTMPQSSLALPRRAENVRGCFDVVKLSEVRGRDIILVDDVTTSGSTFFEAATALRKAGAKTILALAVAKA